MSPNVTRDSVPVCHTVQRHVLLTGACVGVNVSANDCLALHVSPVTDR